MRESEEIPNRPPTRACRSADNSGRRNVADSAVFGIRHIGCSASELNPHRLKVDRRLEWRSQAIEKIIATAIDIPPQHFLQIDVGVDIPRSHGKSFLTLALLPAQSLARRSDERPHSSPHRRGDGDSPRGWKLP